MIPVGFTLQPHEPTLELCEPLIEGEVDYYEVAPETLWRPDDAGRFVPNGFHRRFEALRERTERPFVAHGVGLSVGETTLGTTVGNLGFEKVEFPKPVFHGDTIYSETEVVDKRESRSRPQWGIVTFVHRALNQRGEVVMVARRNAMMRKKGA